MLRARIERPFHACRKSLDRRRAPGNRRAGIERHGHSAAPDLRSRTRGRRIRCTCSRGDRTRRRATTSGFPGHRTPAPRAFRSPESHTVETLRRREGEPHRRRETVLPVERVPEMAPIDPCRKRSPVDSGEKIRGGETVEHVWIRGSRMESRALLPARDAPEEEVPGRDSPRAAGEHTRGAFRRVRFRTGRVRGGRIHGRRIRGGRQPQNAYQHGRSRSCRLIPRHDDARLFLSAYPSSRPDILDETHIEPGSRKGAAARAAVPPA